MSTPERSPEFIQEACNLAETCKRAGDSPERVEAKLIESGLTEGEAAALVRATFRPEQSAARSSAGWAMLGGLALMAVGGGATFASYSAAASNPGGGSYTIWWGPVVWGGVIFVGALVRFVSGKE